MCVKVGKRFDIARFTNILKPTNQFLVRVDMELLPTALQKSDGDWERCVNKFIIDCGKNIYVYAILANNIRPSS